MLTYLLFFILGLYAVATIFLWFFWLKIPIQKNEEFIHLSPFFISVLVPIRNEEAHIARLLEDLSKQNYPASHFEVIVIDDSSTDQSVAIVQAYQQKYADKMKLSLYQLAPEEATRFAPKKQALQLGIQNAKGEIIVTTDGDCRVLATWLLSIAQAFRQQGAYLVSSLVTFASENKLFSQLQIIEFASLIGAGAVSIFAGFPTMCNGANLAYRKNIFNAVGGFEGIDNIASGDDELLMRKIAQKYPQKIHFLKAKEAIVSSYAQATWYNFYQQRKRWASKWRFYPDSYTKFIAIFIFLTNSSLLFIPILTYFSYQNFYLTLLQIVLKIIPEWLFVGSILVFLGKKKLFLYIPLLQIVYPFYVLFFGIVAITSRSYEWKQRRLA